MKLLIYILPFFLAFNLILGLAFYIGDALPFSVILKQQQDSQILYSPNFQFLDHFHYKLSSLKVRQPEIVVLGASRAEFVSEHFFNQQSDIFYNAHVQGSSINEQVQIVRFMADNDILPSIIFLQLDLPDYNGNAQGFRTDALHIQQPTLFDYGTRLQASLEYTAREVISNPTRLRGRILRVHANPQLTIYGWSALTQRYGYLNDGSLYLKYLTYEVANRRLQEHFDYLENHTRMYGYGTSLSDNTLASLDEILEIASVHNSLVIGYLPPYHSQIFTELTNDNYSYMRLARDVLPAIFAEHQMQFFDFTEINTITDAGDNELFDGWHPTTLLDMRMYLTMMHSQPDVFSTYADLTSLEQQIEAVENPFYVFTSPDW